MDNNAKQKWDHIYAAKTATAMQPANVLTEYAHLLPTSGNALDLACGLGANAIFLAQHGLKVHAWDISEQAIDRLMQISRKQNLQINTAVRDVQKHPPSPNSFDVVCVSYYLERDITDAIFSALTPNGLLFYQTFIHERVSEHGPSNPKYRLAENELLNMFSGLHVLVYQEQGRVGDIEHGLRNIAMLIAQKR